jgi:hypothetical protein
MGARTSSKPQRQRELRRRVLVPARLRHGSSWSDVCILNVSSRGLMIHTGRAIAHGSRVEVRRGDHVIIAQVVWREGGRAGLRAEDRVPVEDIVTLGQSPSLQLTAANSERRKHPRSDDHSRIRGRAIEFCGFALIAAALTGAGLSMVGAAFARPLAAVSAALGQ